jgi:hypothetical protein
MINCEPDNCDHNNAWLSAHIFYFDNLDNLILDGIQPLIRSLHQQEKIESYFFIRYWQGGPHIRLRLLGQAATLANEVKPYLTTTIGKYLAESPATSSIDEAEIKVSHIWMAEREYQKREFIPLYSNNSLHWIDYQPEYHRYGGKTGVAIAERHFRDSSEMAFQVLTRSRAASNQRTGLALQLLTVLPLMLGIPLAKLSSYFANYSDIWLCYFDNLPTVDLKREFHQHYLRQQSRLLPFFYNLVSLLTGKAKLAGPLLIESWIKALAVTAIDLRQASANKELPLRALGLPDWLKKDSPQLRQYRAIRDSVEMPDHERLIIDLIRSYLHMTCNRLGISLFDEAYLAFLIASALNDCNSNGTLSAHQYDQVVGVSLSS